MVGKSKLVTLCILSKNEERLLDACLNYHARFFENIAVLDGSDDWPRVEEIANRHKAAAVHREFSGSFAEERNALAGYAPTNWVLMIDCDELADWSLLNSLDEKAKAHAIAYRIKRLNIEPLDPSPETYEVRLYDKTRAKYERDVHEILIEAESGIPADQTGWVITLDDNPIIHALKCEQERKKAWDRWDAMARNTKDVLVAVLVRNQAKWLPRFLESLDRLEYSKKHLYFAFLEGDSTDGSLEMLGGWAKDRGNVIIGKMNIPTDAGRFDRLARLRNAMVERFAGEVDYFLWADSDIILPPDLLRNLMEVHVPIVAPMIFIEGTAQFYDTLAFRRGGAGFSGAYPYFKGFSRGKHQLDSVGTCYLVDVGVYKSGARYSDGISEHVTFCEAARKKGFSVWLDAEHKAYHINLTRYGEAWH